MKDLGTSLSSRSFTATGADLQVFEQGELAIESITLHVRTSLYTLETA